MIQYDNFLELFLNNAKKLFYPEEWVNIDLSLSKTEIICLLWMSRNNEVIMSQIAELLDIPMSTATGVINRLVKKGYVERYRSETDRRIVVIRLTEQGQQLIDEVKASASHYFSLITAALTEDEKTSLFHMFQKIITHLSTTQEQQPQSKPTSKIKNIPIE